MWFQSSTINLVLTWFPSLQETWISIAFLKSHYSRWSGAVFHLSCFYSLQSLQNYVLFTMHSWENLIFVLLLIIFLFLWLRRWTKIFLKDIFFWIHLINETFFYTHSQTWKIWRKKWLLILANTLKGSWKYMLFKRCYFSWAS